jgi:hypothetical protein
MVGLATLFDQAAAPRGSLARQRALAHARGQLGEAVTARRRSQYARIDATCFAC